MSSPHVVAGAPKAAVIGGGFIGPVHVEALRRIGVDVVGVMGSSPERARPMAERLAVPRVYRDLDELMADSAVGAVHVASPNQFHFEQATRLLESGRHVLCEKPLATTSAETNAMCTLANSRPSQLAAVNYNVRFYPILHEMRARVERGDIGRVLCVAGCYTQDWLLYPRDYNWRVEPDGGTNLRTVGDIGTHWMDLAQFVIGQPIRAVLADIATFHPTRYRLAQGASDTFVGAANPAEARAVPVKTEDYAAVLLRIGDDVRGSFHVSQMIAGRKNRIALEIAGTEGSLAWDCERPNQVWIGHRNHPNQILERDPALLSPVASAMSEHPGGHAEGFPDTFKQLFRSVYEWIASGGPDGRAFPTFDDGHREVQLCEAIARSAAEQRWVDVEP